MKEDDARGKCPKQGTRRINGKVVNKVLEKRKIKVLT